MIPSLCMWQFCFFFLFRNFDIFSLFRCCKILQWTVFCMGSIELDTKSFFPIWNLNSFSSGEFSWILSFLISFCFIFVGLLLLVCQTFWTNCVIFSLLSISLYFALSSDRIPLLCLPTLILHFLCVIIFLIS